MLGESAENESLWNYFEGGPILSERIVGKKVQIEGRKGSFFVISKAYDHKGTALFRVAPVGETSVQPFYISAEKVIVDAKQEEWSPLTRLLLDCLTESGCRSSSELFFCKATFKPYQFRPLLKFVASDRRTLIADETGLGKTIEASYIILDEIVRNRAKRILIVCPSHLKIKWRGELWNRFGLAFQIMSGRSMMSALRDDRGRFQGIVSIDALKGDRTESLTNISHAVDLLIIDEVHNTIGRGGDTFRRRMCMRLSSISKGVVGISASPIHLEEDDLYRVLEVVDPGRTDHPRFVKELRFTKEINDITQRLSTINISETDAEIIRRDIVKLLQGHWSCSEKAEVEILLDDGRWMSEVKDRDALRKCLARMIYFAPMMTRTRRAEVGEERERSVKNVRIILSNDPKDSILNSEERTEQRLFDELDRLFLEKFSHVHRRQLASSMPAIIDLLYKGMAGFNYWQDDDLVTCKEAVDENTRERCKDLANGLKVLRVDSKWNQLKSDIDELFSSGKAVKIIVFTQWLPTFRYLSARLSRTGYKLFAASGDTDEESRDRIMRGFQEHAGPCLLLVTDIMSEGIDLQTSNCVISYDLPYNPQRIEQRIGRVDRVGQKSPEIHVINLITVGSTDENVYKILIQRSDIFTRAIGELPLAIGERIQKYETIDANEVVQEINRFLDKKGITSLETIKGLDEALDEDIKITFDRKGHGRQAWLASLITEFVEVCMDPERVSVTVPGDGTVEVSGLNSLDIDILVGLVPMNQMQYVRNDITRNMQDDNLRLDLVGRGEGLFVPPGHPLVSGIVDRMLNMVDLYVNRAIPLFSSPVAAVESGPRLIVRFRYRGRFENTNMIMIFHLGDGETATKVLEIDELFDDEGNGPTYIGVLDKEDVRALTDMVAIEHEKWLKEMSESEERADEERRRRRHHVDAALGASPLFVSSELTQVQTDGDFEILGVIKEREGGGTHVK